MNKVFNVNIGGILFAIDESAYERLNNYLASIRNHFSGTDGSQEIIADIEARIAEMLQEKIYQGKPSVAPEDVDSIIKAMGLPEDFDDTDSEKGTGSKKQWSDESSYGIPRKKRLFRDPDNKIVGGVCAGIGAYLNIDPVWIRLGFVVIFFTFGSGLLAYIILMIVMPKAVTVADKLEMRGEDVTINNIKKNINEEYNELKDSFERFRSGNNGKKAEGIIGRFFEAIATLIIFVAKVFAKVMAAAMIGVGFAVLVALLLSFFGIIPDVDLVDIFGTGWQSWVAKAGLILFIGIPLLGLVIKGIQILFNVQTKNRMARKLLVGLWIIGLVTVFVMGGYLAKDYSEDGVISKSYTLNHVNSDTLYIEGVDTSMAHIRSRRSRGWRRTGILQWSRSGIVKNVGFDIVKNTDRDFVLLVEYEANGEDENAAIDKARQIEYHFQQKDSILLLNKYISQVNTNGSTGFLKRKLKFIPDQTVHLTLKVPEGKVVKIGGNMHNFLDDVKNITNTYDEDMVGHNWKMTSSGLKCLDCRKKRITIHRPHRSRDRTEVEEDIIEEVEE